MSALTARPIVPFFLARRCIMIAVRSRHDALRYCPVTLLPFVRLPWLLLHVFFVAYQRARPLAPGFAFSIGSLDILFPWCDRSIIRYHTGSFWAHATHRCFQRQRRNSTTRVGSHRISEFPHLAVGRPLLLRGVVSKCSPSPCSPEYAQIGHVTTSDGPPRWAGPRATSYMLGTINGTSRPGSYSRR